MEFVTWTAAFLCAPQRSVALGSACSHRISPIISHHSVGSFSKDSLSPCRAAHSHLQTALLGRTFPKESFLLSPRGLWRAAGRRRCCAGAHSCVLVLPSQGSMGWGSPVPAGSEQVRLESCFAARVRLVKEAECSPAAIVCWMAWDTHSASPSAAGV